MPPNCYSPRMKQPNPAFQSGYKGQLALLKPTKLSPLLLPVPLPAPSIALLHPLSSAFVLPPRGAMSCHSYHAGSGSSPRNFSSCSEVLPPKGAPCHVSSNLCQPIDIGICYGGPGGFSSRSIGSYGLRLATSSSVPGSGPQSGVGVTSGYCGLGYNYSFLKAGGIIKAPSVSGIAPVTCNESLLQPLQLGIDSMALSVKHQAKNELQSLNSRLASFIDKVSGRGAEGEYGSAPSTFVYLHTQINIYAVCSLDLRF